MLKVLSVLGTRPEAIKMAPVIQELQKHGKDIVSRVCTTAQHRKLSDQVLNLFDITPDYDLNVMTHHQSPSDVTAAVLARLDAVLRKDRPDRLLVQGDTVTVMAAALSAYYHRVPVGHVEAGLRSFDKFRPFPEEVMRQIADVIADLHFAPTDAARDNLIRSGVAPETITVTGNTVIDALLRTVARAPCASRDIASIPSSRRMILVTAHRRESFGQPLLNMCAALLRIVARYPDVHVVFPVHPNPQVAGPVASRLGSAERIALVDPMDYPTFVAAMQRSHLILTDSGGVQEEAPSLGKPVLVLREVTERPEAVAAGVAEIAGTDRADIVRHVARLLDDPVAYQAMARAVNPYGDGQAAARIVRILLEQPRTA